MGKTHRHFGRENGEDAKFHRWWRNNENDWCRKDNDRIKVAELATSVVRNEKVSIKTRKTAIPRSKEIKSPLKTRNGDGMLQTQLTLKDGMKKSPTFLLEAVVVAVTTMIERR